jgi:glycosyltransferase involved in cell wall biosynthesis
MLHRVVMVATSYPRFDGDTVGTFMEPIAKGLAARGHEVHLVLPWHPLLRRSEPEDGVHFHAFHYAPVDSWHLFGYATSLRADVRLRRTALLLTPTAVAAGWRLTRRIVKQIDATIVHGHWVVPGGAIASWASGARPLAISLHGSDVFIAERHSATRAVTRRVLSRAGAIIACSDDLRERAVALGADPLRAETIAYGVDTARFAPDAGARARVRAEAGLTSGEEVVLGVGRFVSKKGFEYLIDAVGLLADRRPALRLVLAGWGDLERDLRARAARLGLEHRVRFTGLVTRDGVPGWLAAADIVAVPSIRDEAGNVDGLPNVALEALASATPVVATRAGGLGTVIESERTGLLVPERDATALAAALDRLLADRELGTRIGAAARATMESTGRWANVAARIEAAYDRAVRLHNG